MPQFTFIKHADNEKDTNVTVTFQEDQLSELRIKIDDFLRGSGFFWDESEESNEEEFQPLPRDYRIRSTKEWEWTEDDYHLFNSDL